MVQALFWTFPDTGFNVFMCSVCVCMCVVSCVVLVLLGLFGCVDG